MPTFKIENYSGAVYYDVLKALKIETKVIAPISQGTYWIDPVKVHLNSGCLSKKALKVSVWSLIYALIYGILYTTSFVLSYLKCLRLHDAKLALRKVPKGICR